MFEKDKGILDPRTSSLFFPLKELSSALIKTIENNKNINFL